MNFVDFEKYNHNIARNVSCVEEMEVFPAYISNYNLSGVH